MVDDGAERPLVSLREREAIVVLSLLILEDKVTTVDDLLIGNVSQLLGLLTRKLRHCRNKEAERGDALLAVNDEELVHA